MSIILKWFSSVIVVNILLIVWLGFVENSNESLMLWARYTARISAVYFLLSFSASSLNYFFSNTLTKLIRRQRRYVGLSFALAHIIHLGALISFFVITGNPTPSALLIGGGFGYIFVFAMALTSNDKAVKKLGLNLWKKIHWFGANYIAVIFVIVYGGKLLNGQANGNDSDPLTFASIVGAFLMVFILRIAHFWKSKNSTISN